MAWGRVPRASPASWPGQIAPRRLELRQVQPRQVQHRLAEPFPPERTLPCTASSAGKWSWSVVSCEAPGLLPLGALPKHDFNSCAPADAPAAALSDCGISGQIAGFRGEPAGFRGRQQLSACRRLYAAGGERPPETGAERRAGVHRRTRPGRLSHLRRRLFRSGDSWIFFP